MLERRKKAKDFLEDSRLSKFNDVINESKLTPRQKEIVEMRFVKNWSHVKISLKLNFSEVSIKKEMEKVYDKVYNLFVL